MNRRGFIQGVAALTFLPVSTAQNMLKVPAVIDSPIEKELVPVSEAQYVNMTVTLADKFHQKLFSKQALFEVNGKGFRNLEDINFPEKSVIYLYDEVNRQTIETVLLTYEGRIIFYKTIKPTDLHFGDIFTFAKGNINITFQDNFSG